MIELQRNPWVMGSVLKRSPVGQACKHGSGMDLSPELAFRVEQKGK